MTRILPQINDTQNSPSHSFLHRVVSVDTSSPESSIDVDASGNVLVAGNVTADNLSNTNTGDQVADGVTITGAGTVADPFVGAPSYTDEQAQDAVGNAVGTGLDYDDTSGAISVDLTETTAVVTDPATQARNTIQPTADVTGLTVKKYYAPATAIDPSTLGAVRVAHYIADDFTSGATPWPDASGNGYTLTAGGGGASKVLNVVNGHAVVRFTQNNHSYRNTAGFTLAQPFVIFMVASADRAGTSTPGSNFIANGSGSTAGVIAQYYESVNYSPGWTTYGGSAWTPTDAYGTVGRFQVTVAKYNGASTYIRCGGNVNTTGSSGTGSMTGITIGNSASNLAGADGDIAEVIILNDPDDATIAGIEAWLASKYNTELESATQQQDLIEFHSGVGETLNKITKDGTIIPTLFGASKSALNIGTFSDAYPRWKLTPARFEMGDGTYDVMGQTGLYQNGWEFQTPSNVSTSLGRGIQFTSKSNYVDQVFIIRQPGNGGFSYNTGLCRMALNSANANHIGAESTTGKGLIIKAFAGQTPALLELHNSSGVAMSAFDVTGKLGIGTATPTAILHLKAGTATANTAPLKFTSGTSLTTAEAGAVEFTTDDFFATITTGTARKAFVLDDGTRLTSGKIPVATTNGRLVDVTPQAYEADLKVDYTTGDLDTEAEIITAINATNTKINAIITKLETLGLLASS